MDLKFLHNVRYPLCVMFHVSHVTCRVPHVTCHNHVSHIKKNGQSGGASRSRVCYQRGLPRLVYILLLLRVYWDKLLYIGLLGDYHGKQGKLQHYVELNHCNSVKCLFRRLWMDGMAEF